MNPHFDHSESGTDFVSPSEVEMHPTRNNDSHHHHHHHHNVTTTSSNSTDRDDPRQEGDEVAVALSLGEKDSVTTTTSSINLLFAPAVGRTACTSSSCPGTVETEDSIAIARMLSDPMIGPPTHFLDVYELKGIVASFLLPEDVMSFCLVSRSCYYGGAKSILDTYRGQFERGAYSYVVARMKEEIPENRNYVCLYTGLNFLSLLLVGILYAIDLVVHSVIVWVMGMMAMFVYRCFAYMFLSRQEPDRYTRRSRCDVCVRLFLPVIYIYLVMGVFSLPFIEDWHLALDVEANFHAFPAECLAEYYRPIGSDHRLGYAYINFTQPELWVPVGEPNHVHRSYNGFWNHVYQSVGEVNITFQFLLFTGGNATTGRDSPSWEVFCAPYWSSAGFIFGPSDADAVLNSSTRNQTQALLNALGHEREGSTRTAGGRWSEVVRPFVAIDWSSTSDSSVNSSTAPSWAERLAGEPFRFFLQLQSSAARDNDEETFNRVPFLANGVTARGRRSASREQRIGWIAVTVSLLAFTLVLGTPILYETVRYLVPLLRARATATTALEVVDDAIDECVVFDLSMDNIRRGFRLQRIRQKRRKWSAVGDDDGFHSSSSSGSGSGSSSFPIAPPPPDGSTTEEEDGSVDSRSS